MTITITIKNEDETRNIGVENFDRVENKFIGGFVHTVFPGETLTVHCHKDKRFMIQEI